MNKLLSVSILLNLFALGCIFVAFFAVQGQGALLLFSSVCITLSIIPQAVHGTAADNFGSGSEPLEKVGDVL